MPPLTILGIVHTAFAIVALICAVIALFRDKEISPQNRVGQIYIVTTAITAATSFGIYQHGGFGFQHIFSVFTLLGLALGMFAGFTEFFGNSSRYVQAISFTTTLLLHLIPGVTEMLTRLPAGDPIVHSYSEPTLKVALVLVLVAFLVGVALQIRWLQQNLVSD
jgi:uncharacterized membrane protein